MLMRSEQKTNAPYCLAADGGTPMAWFDATISLKASNPGLGITEVVLHPGEEPPFHIHRNEDEWLYIVEGQVTFHVGGEDYRGGPGAFASYPRGIAHTFT